MGVYGLCPPKPLPPEGRPRFEGARGGGGPQSGAGGGRGRAGGAEARTRTPHTAPGRLGGLASGFRVWVNGAGRGTVRAGRVYNGRDSPRGFELGTNLAPPSVSLSQ